MATNLNETTSSLFGKAWNFAITFSQVSNAHDVIGVA